MLLEKKLINRVPVRKNGTKGPILQISVLHNLLQNGQPQTVNLQAAVSAKSCVYRKPDIRDESFEILIIILRKSVCGTLPPTLATTRLPSHQQAGSLQVATLVPCSLQVS